MCTAGGSAVGGGSGWGGGRGGVMDVDSRLPQLAMFMYSCIENVKIRRRNPSRIFLNTRQRSPPPPQEKNITTASRRACEMERERKIENDALGN